ncbi:HCLS1-associated protein X-1 isoform X1 [Lepidochelys kempii]|uniref:HCLS1-associated protein X-1 isoform X1 n=1 Tax=Lepidochelys kempii TaxID=8472 RepID=UPI003C6F0A93
MSLYELFRGFFGFPRGRRPRDPFFGGITRDEDEEDEYDEDGGPSFGVRPTEDFGFSFSGMRFHDNFGFGELFRDFNELFNEMGAWTLPCQPFELPVTEAAPAASGHLSEEQKRRALRDSMLKYPDSHQPRISEEGTVPGRDLGDGAGLAAPGVKPWQPFAGLGEMHLAPPSAREDKDLDSRVSSEGLETVLRPGEPKAHSYFQSVSVTTVTGPDGRSWRSLWVTGSSRGGSALQTWATPSPSWRPSSVAGSQADSPGLPRSIPGSLRMSEPQQRNPRLRQALVPCAGRAACFPGGSLSCSPLLPLRGVPRTCRGIKSIYATGLM